MPPILNLFYAEPDPDRFVRFDRYPRKVLRRLVRGPRNPGGQERVFLNLCAGLDRLGVAYRVNDFRYARAHSDELACIIGKPHLLDAVPWKNPILFGASVFSHPVDDPDLLRRLPVTKVLVPGEWMRQMFESHYGDKVVAWPVGIDTERWAPEAGAARDVDVLLYDKVRWKHDQYKDSLIDPILEHLGRRQLRVAVIRYGCYREEQYLALLRRAKSMVFLCEHETQGIAYQQALSCGVPIFAWDRGGWWEDPAFYPHKVRFGPVSSVPYWDGRCGMRFADLEGFRDQCDTFLEALTTFYPRSYVLEHLTLQDCARRYVELVGQEQRGC